MYNKALTIAAALLVPTLVFWASVLIYTGLEIGHPLIRAFARLENSPSGIVLVVAIVIGCPFFALPLAVFGRWFAKVHGGKGEAFGITILALSVILLVLGIALPIALR